MFHSIRVDSDTVDSPYVQCFTLYELTHTVDSTYVQCFTIRVDSDTVDSTYVHSVSLYTS